MQINPPVKRGKVSNDHVRWDPTFQFLHTGEVGPTYPPPVLRPLRPQNRPRSSCSVFIYLSPSHNKKKGESPFLPSTINNKIHRLFLTSLSTISLFLYFCESEASEEEEEVLWAAKQWRNRARTTRSCVWPAKLRSMRAERSRRWSCRSASPRAAGYGENPAAWVATWPNLGFSQSPVRDPFPSFFFSPAIRIIFFFIYLFVCHFGI